MAIALFGNGRWRARRVASLLGCLLGAVALQGCATRAWNAPTSLAASTFVNAAHRLAPRGRSDDIFVVLAFSGGGTRSAAFAYGILEALRDQPITVHGHSRRLLDEVDVVTSVSGGSYTAAYYGLFGERIFTRFESAFLKRDVQSELLSLLANPLAVVSLTSPEFNRSDLAAEWLGQNVFQDKTVGDMNSRSGPFIIINASDINTGMTFSFIQQQFDFLCSEISRYPVANAVMASSAVPGYFAPIAVHNHNIDCPERRASWVKRALEQPNIYSRNYQVARALERYQDPPSMPVVRLVDGGVTDNLGVRGSMMSPVMHYGNVEEMVGAFSEEQLDKVSKVLVVVANAQTYEDYIWSQHGKEPSLIGSVSASFDSAIGILNNETIGLARRGFMQWADRINRRAGRRGTPPVNVQFAALTFDQIRDADERRWFNAIPTKLSLRGDQVDNVRAIARRLLEQAPEYRRFVDSLQ